MTDSFKFSKKWIKKIHSLNEIREWLCNLNYFKYFRAFGGHMNDGDSFKMCLEFKDFDELLRSMNAMGFHMNKSILKEQNEYDNLTPEYDKVKGHPEYKKPGHQELLGADWFLWIENKSLIITIAGTGLEHKYDVTSKDFEKCMEFEKLIKELGLDKNVDAKFNYTIGCISTENYPDLFENIE